MTHPCFYLGGFLKKYYFTFMLQKIRKFMAEHFDFRKMEKQLDFIQGRVDSAVTQTDLNYCLELTEAYLQVNNDFFRWVGHWKSYVGLIHAIAQKEDEIINKTNIKNG